MTVKQFLLKVSKDSIITFININQEIIFDCVEWEKLFQWVLYDEKLIDIFNSEPIMIEVGKAQGDFIITI